MLRLLLASALSAATLWAPSASAQEWARGEVIEQSVDLPATPEDYVTVEGTFLRVHGPSAETDLLLRLARHGSEALPRLAERLQVPIGQTVHVYVARDDAEFRDLQPGPPPEWADATAWPHAGAVFLRVPSARGGVARPLEQVFDHELVHVLIGRAFGDQVPPHWLQEGAARLLAGEVLPDEAAALVKARGDGSWIPLSSLTTGFPRDAERARLAYAESGDFLGWLHERYGDAVLSELVAASARGAGPNEAVYLATGDLLHEVEAEWIGSHPAPFGARLATLASTDAMWGLAALALAVAGVQRRRQFHRRLEEMGREEAEFDAMMARLRERRAAQG